MDFMSNMQLADASNNLVYASMVILFVATISFSVSFAAGRRRESQLEVASRRVLVESGGSEVQGSEIPLIEIDPGRRAANIGMSLTWLAAGMLLAGVILRGVVGLVGCLGATCTSFRFPLPWEFWQYFWCGQPAETFDGWDSSSPFRRC